MANKSYFVRGNISLLDMIQGDFRDNRVKQAVVRFPGRGIVLLRSDPEDRDHVRVILARGKKESGMSRFYTLRQNEEEGREDVRIPLSYLRGEEGMEAETEEQEELLEELQEAVREGCNIIQSKRMEKASASTSEVATA